MTPEHTMPPAPPTEACRVCKKDVPPIWIPPRPLAAPAGQEPQIMHGTGRWLGGGDLCDDCTVNANTASDPVKIEERRRAKLLQDLALPPKLAKMELEQLRGDLPQDFADAIHAARHHGTNLYLWSDVDECGVGKTHAAVGLLKHYVRNLGLAGQFYVAPELFDTMREEIRHGRAGALTDRISKAEALVIDDLGAEKTTETVLERLYLIVSRWDSWEKKHLVITSNLSLGQVSEKLDPRIASRLKGMCRVVKVTGEDWRIKMAKERGS